MATFLMEVRTHPKWWFELLIVLAFDRTYELMRNLVPEDKTVAYAHGRGILGWEHRVGLSVERSANAALVARPALATASNYFYGSMYVVATLGVLAWLYLRHPEHYHAGRFVLGTITFLALVGFWLYPTAPPRLLGDGFVDTSKVFGDWASWNSPTVAARSNQYAAMPSLHCAWSLWCAVVVARVARSRGVRVLGAGYAVCTVAVVLGTANHYVLDAVAGWSLVGVALLAYRAIYRIRPLRDPWLPAAETGPASAGVLRTHSVR